MMEEEPHKSSDNDANFETLFDLSKLSKAGGIKAGEFLAVDPEILEKSIKHMGRTVKKDLVARNMVYITGLSAYTREPINLFLRGEPSIGKTYNATQSLWYFPVEDVWMLGALSPTALVHTYGILVDSSGKEINLAERPAKEASETEKEAWRQRLLDSRTIVDLKGKILVFLESPRLETYNMLRPILSHDKEEISYRFTDKTGKGQLRAIHVVIRGWPAAIFCTTEERYVKDLATRGFTLTPETGSAKFKEAIGLLGEKKALPWKFHEDDDFMLLQGYICWLRGQLEDLKVAVPFGRELAKHYPSEYARSMRDFSHLTALIEVLALFHCMQRPVLVRAVKRRVLSGEGEFVTDEEKYILATRKDLEYILDLWEKIEETTVTGMPEHILHFYHKAVAPLSGTASFSIEELTKKYNEEAQERKSSDTIQRWVKNLCDVGWLSKDPGPLDKRRVLIHNIRNPEDIRNSTQILNAVTFSLENFKRWVNDAEQITARNHISYRLNLLAETPSTPEEIYQKYYLYKNGLGAVNPPSPEPIPPAKTTPKVKGNRKYGDLHSIWNIENTLGWLRLEWTSGHGNQVLSIMPLDPVTRGNCPLCQKDANLVWQIQFLDGSRYDALCVDCGGKVKELVREFEALKP